MSAAIRDAARARLDALAKPAGSLGRLEELAVHLAAAQGTLRPAAAPRRLLVFAGDHGVVEEGVGPWPAEVTAALIRLTLEGRSSGAALATATGTRLTLVDAGTRGPAFEPHPDYRDWRVAPGTANLARGPAMSAAQLRAALAVGARAARESAQAGDRVLAVGELGIGNSTAAACLAALLLGAPSEAVVGPGAGGTAEHLRRKRAVVAAAVARCRAPLDADPEAAIAAVGGFEVLAIAGCVTEAARLGIPVVLDGFIAGAGALVAAHLDAGALRTAVAAHRSQEPGHALILARLGLVPFLDWNLRLGEGTGALLLLPALDAAAALLTGVARLDEVMGADAAR